VYQIVEKLKENYDMSTLTYKLLSLVLNNENPQEGKEKIGK